MEVKEASATYLRTTGYKQTEVGVIPEDWEVVPLGRLIFSVEYGSSAKSNVEGHTPVLRMGNLQGGKIDWNDLVFTDDESEIRKYSLITGDVLFNRTNTIDLVGKTAIYKGERPAVFAGYLIRINADKALLDTWFLNYVLNAEFSRRHSAKVLSVAVGQANINGQKLKSYPIPIPPTKAEQEAIAEALCDADALIEALEQLLAKKRHLKQGVMQELLTGKKRLPGFSGEWEVKRLGELALLSKSGVNPGSTPSAFFTHFSLPAFDAGEIPVVEQGSLIGSNKFVVPPNAVLLSKLNPRIPRIWAPSHIPTNAVCSTEFLVLIPRENIDRDFLAVVCRSPAVSYQMELHAIGTTGSHQRINPSQALSIEVNSPRDKDEQTAIATILSDMDVENAALEEKLAKARHLKHGMMQELLTGRIRLV